MKVMLDLLRGRDRKQKLILNGTTVWLAVTPRMRRVFFGIFHVKIIMIEPLLLECLSGNFYEGRLKHVTCTYADFHLRTS